MKIKVRGQNLEVTDALRDYAEKKVGRLEKYFNASPTSDANIALGVDRDGHGVEVTIPMPGVLLRAEEKSTDMYASIDLVVEKLERQIRKHKTKVNRKFRQEGSIRSLFKEADPLVNGEAIVVQEDDDEYEVVRTKRFTLKPMDIEEAILQMNLLGHSFFVFSNAVTNETNVVYRRDDGRYGLIESGA